MFLVVYRDDTDRQGNVVSAQLRTHFEEGQVVYTFCLYILLIQ
jgi:hypothetical protein